MLVSLSFLSKLESNEPLKASIETRKKGSRFAMAPSEGARAVIHIAQVACVSREPTRRKVYKGERERYLKLEEELDHDEGVTDRARDERESDCRGRGAI